MIYTHRPLSIHFLVTPRCNLRCPECYYSYDGPSEVSYDAAKELITEWANYGVLSIAIGGGEPTLHPDIDGIVAYAKRKNLYVVLTSNGTIHKKFATPPDRIHFSFDDIHPTSKREIFDAIDFYRTEEVDKIGINHVVTDLVGVSSVYETFHDQIDTITLLSKKPESGFNRWGELKDVTKDWKDVEVWWDACKSLCMQGKTSMSVFPDLTASKCSNIGDRVEYTNLAETWYKIQNQFCPHLSEVNGKC